MKRWLRRWLRVTGIVALALMRPRAWPILFPFVGLIVGFAASPDEAHSGFYEAAAQVIPVLLLVLAVELRFFRFSGAAFTEVFGGRLGGPPLSVARSEFGRARQGFDLLATEGSDPDADRLALMMVRPINGVVVLAVLVAGELAALHPLAVGDDAAGDPGLVYAAILCGLAAIVSLAILSDDATG